MPRSAIWSRSSLHCKHLRLAAGVATLFATFVVTADAQQAEVGRPGSALDQLPAEVKSAYEGIQGDEIIASIRFLASPRLEGRDAGERGAEIAADYLVSRFQAIGLQAGSKEGYLQRFDLLRRTLAPEDELTLLRQKGGSTTSRELQLRTDWVPFSFSEIGTVEAPVVFAGYGIVAPEYKWDDYAALGANGARGKVVLVLRHEPDETGKSGPKFFDGREMTLHASLRQKARVAAAHGAVALVVVDDPLHHEVSTNPSSGLASWNFLTEEESKLAKDDPKRPRGTVTVEGEHQPLGVLAAHASQEILRWLAPDRDWKALQEDLDGSRKSKAFAIADVSLRFVHAPEVERQATSNVLAVLPGSDPVLAQEYVLVGGHYDHVGRSRTTNEIHPGADDNASGTSAVIAIAEAIAALPKAPARSILFVGWGAEERGLLGSAFFVRKPAIALDKIVAGINLDMVGRNKESEISVVGRTEAPDFAALFDRFAPAVGFALNDDAGAGASRSDNGMLWLGGVPTVSLFSGTHEDYHQPEDTADKVLPGKVEKAARLSFLVALEVAEGRMTPAPLDVPAGPWKPIAPKREPRPIAAADAGAKMAAGEQKGVGAKGRKAGAPGSGSASGESTSGTDAASAAPNVKPEEERR